jgi:hypothetical protein
VPVHAGDLSNPGTRSELRKTVGWIEAADFEVKIVVAGKDGCSPLGKAPYATYTGILDQPR